MIHSIVACFQSLKVALMVGLSITLFSVPRAGSTEELPVRKVRVGVFGDAPFAMRDTSGGWQGFSVEVFNEISSRMRLVLEYREFDSLEELYRGVAAGAIEVGIGDTLVTGDALERVDFSQPILDGGLRVVVGENKKHSFQALWEGLREGGHLSIIGWTAGAVVLLSVLVLLTLRVLDPEFTRYWHEGLAEAFYFVVSVFTTGKTGYQGRVGSGWLGRILSALWLIFGVATVSYLTSSITSVMTTNLLTHRIVGPKDLPGKVVGVLSGASAEKYCAVREIQVKRFNKLDDAIQGLIQHEVDAVVSDSTSVEYFDTSHSDLPIAAIGEVFERRHFAFAVSKEAGEIRSRINVGLLNLREAGTFDRIRDEYFGR